MSGGDLILETPRLILRSWADGDEAELARHCNSPTVMRWIGPVQTAEEIAAGIARSRALQIERGFCHWVVERKADRAFLGFCGLRIAIAAPFAEAEEFEVGWRLREDVWGQGFAREAATASLDYAFGTLGTARVVALTVAQNEASWGLMERLGMRRRADLDHHDPAYSEELNPTIVYVIEREEWRP